MTIEKIMAAIPHRKPMLLVDEIIEQSENRIVCKKTFAGDEYFFQGHYPDFPLVPGVILCECGAQAGAILLSDKVDGEDGGVPVLTRMNDVRFKNMVRPDDIIHSEVQIDEIVSNAFFLSAKITCEGKLCVRFKFACSIAKTE